MSQTKTTTPTPLPFPGDLALEVARFTFGTALDGQRRALELMARQGTETTRLAQEVLGAAEAATQQAIGDGLQLVRTSAERVQAFLAGVSFRAA